MKFADKIEWGLWRFLHVRHGPFRRFEEWFFGCRLDRWDRAGYAVGALLYIAIAGSTTAAIVYEVVN